MHSLRAGGDIEISTAPEGSASIQPYLIMVRTSKEQQTLK